MAATRTPSPSLADTVGRGCGENVCKCYQCKKCTSGCPVAGFTGMHPAQIMRAIQLGQLDLAIEDRFIWICTGCQTCSTRCPQGIDVAAVMDELKIIARKERRIPRRAPLAEVLRLNADSIKRWGRMYEFELAARALFRRPKDVLAYLPVGWKMLLKRKVTLLPKRGDSTAVKRMAKLSEKLMSKPRAVFQSGEGGCS